jgi:hypothetical protein
MSRKWTRGAADLDDSGTGAQFWRVAAQLGRTGTQEGLMKKNRFAGLLGLFTLAVGMIVAFPSRVVAFARDSFALLFDPRPAFDRFETPALALDAPVPPSIASSLFNRNRHEAGLARLGSVRHT